MKVGSSSFGTDYIANASFQQEVNKVTINKIAKKISENFIAGKYHSSALNIMDLACGHGQPTYELLKCLKELSVPVEQITGYDLSAELIEQAKNNYADIPELKFEVQNMETISDTNKFDAAVSFFGLQWADDISNVAKLINNSLKHGGSIMFTMPLDQKEFFEGRLEFLANNASNYHFKEGFSIKSTIFSPDEHIEAFSKYVDSHTLNIERSSEARHLTFDAMVQFLSSWMTEVRHLRDNGADKPTQSQYVQEFLKDFIPKGTVNDLKYDDKDTSNDVLMKIEMFYYEGDLIGFSDNATTNLNAYDAFLANVMGSGAFTE